MKYDLKAPCAECPFRPDSTPGWLGPDTGKPEIFARRIRGDFEISPGLYVGGEPNDFACHMDVTAQSQKLGDVLLLEDSNLQHCAGALLFLKTSCKQPHDRAKVKAMDKLKFAGPLLKNLAEFLAHHSYKEKKQNGNP